MSSQGPRTLFFRVPQPLSYRVFGAGGCLGNEDCWETARLEAPLEVLVDGASSLSSSYLSSY